MPCELCVSRREFLATAATAAGLGALAACGDGDVSGTAPILPEGPPPGTSITVADYPALANNDVLVRVANRWIAVKRTGPAAFAAFSMRCTHQGCATNIVNGQTFHCPCHGSNFANDGTVINGPFTGDAIGALEPVSTSYDPATDQLTIG